MSPLADLLAEALSTAATDWSGQDLLTLGTWVGVVVFVAGDLAVLHHRQPTRTPVRRAEAAVAVRMASGALAIGVLYGLLFSGLWQALAPHAPARLSRFWAAHPAAGFVATFVAWDLSGFVYHLVGHRTRVGRAAHGAHHSGTEFNGSLALRLSWMPWHGLLHHPLLALAGFDFGVLLMCAAISNFCQALQHSAALPPAPRWLSAVVVTPDAHRHHHGADGHSVNLGPVLTVWDRLAGTWRPVDHASAPLGGGPYRRPLHPVQEAGHTPSRGALRTELGGWVALVRR